MPKKHKPRQLPRPIDAGGSAPSVTDPPSLEDDEAEDEELEDEMDSQDNDTREALLAEMVGLRKHVDSFMASLRGDMAATRELVGRLKDRIDALHERHNQTHSEWAVMKAQMTKHHLEQSSGAEVVGAAVRKANERLDVVEKELQHLTDPHKVINPLKVQVAQCVDGMTKLRTDVNRQLEAFKEDIESKTAELRRAGKPRLS